MAKLLTSPGVPLYEQSINRAARPAAKVTCSVLDADEICQKIRECQEAIENAPSAPTYIVIGNSEHMKERLNEIEAVEAYDRAMRGI